MLRFKIVLFLSFFCAGGAVAMPPMYELAKSRALTIEQVHQRCAGLGEAMSEWGRRIGKPSLGEVVLSAEEIGWFKGQTNAAPEQYAMYRQAYIAEFERSELASGNFVSEELMLDIDFCDRTLAEAGLRPPL